VMLSYSTDTACLWVLTQCLSQLFVILSLQRQELH
jgi:hypothetical protein